MQTPHEHLSWSAYWRDVRRMKPDHVDVDYDRVMQAFLRGLSVRGSVLWLS